MKLLRAILGCLVYEIVLLDHYLLSCEDAGTIFETEPMWMNGMKVT